MGSAALSERRRDPPGPWRPAAVALGLLCLVAGEAEAHAQSSGRTDSVAVAGWVVDATTGEGVPEALVSLERREEGGAGGRVIWAGTTDGDGVFAARVPSADPMVLRAEALGYASGSDTLDLRGARDVDVRVILAADPLELPPVVVVSRRRSRLEAAGFYERRRAGQGYSLTREEIEARRPGRTSDIFRVIPGVQLESPRRGGPPLLRFRGCTPEVVLDGAPLLGPVAVDQILTVNDVEAVEVLSGTFFPARVGVRSCGTVMIWTREGTGTETGEARGLTFGRALFALAYVTVAWFLTR